MRTNTAPHRWFSGWRVAKRARQDDPADLGTAFGLDMSLDPDWIQPPPMVGARPSGWVQRLTARRRAAA